MTENGQKLKNGTQLGQKVGAKADIVKLFYEVPPGYVAFNLNFYTIYFDVFVLPRIYTSCLYLYVCGGTMQQHQKEEACPRKEIFDVESTYNRLQ